MNVGDTLTYTVFGIVASVLLIISIIALWNKNKLYGERSIVISIIAFTLIVITSLITLIYMIKLQVDADDVSTQITGVKNFVWSALAFILLGGALLLYILSTNTSIQIQGFNYFASFLIFEFSLMSMIVIIVNKIRVLSG